MQIVWTETALRHLTSIHDYIERDKPEAAKDVAQAICRGIAFLADHPHLGRPGRKPGTRELIIAGTPYLVPYHVQGDRLTIVAVLHGAQRRRK